MQDGTAGAVALAKPYVDQPVLIIFVDTIFDADLSIVNTTDADGIIWTKEVEDYQRFGVVVTDADGHMTQIVEKPKEPISKRANIGLYYIRNWKLLYEGIAHVLAQPANKGEWYLTDAFQYMIDHGAKIKVVDVDGLVRRGAGGHATSRPTARSSRRGARACRPRSVPRRTIVEPVYIEDGVTIERRHRRSERVRAGGQQHQARRRCPIRSSAGSTAIEHARIRHSLVGDRVTLSHVHGDGVGGRRRRGARERGAVSGGPADARGSRERILAPATSLARRARGGRAGRGGGRRSSPAPLLASTPAWRVDLRAPGAPRTPGVPTTRSRACSACPSRGTRRVRLAIVGTGLRGRSTLGEFLAVEGVQVVALADIVPEKAARAVKMVHRRGACRRRRCTRTASVTSSGSSQRDDIDFVYIATPWEWHMPMALAAMRAGQARGRGGAGRAHDRGLLGAGERLRADAPALPADGELLLRLQRDAGAQHGARRRLR